MKILNLLALKGPNVWSRRTVLEAWVDLEDLRDRPSNELPGLYERLSDWLPGLIEHRCGIGERGGFLMRLRDGTYAGHILEHVTIELQNLAGTPVGFGKARETSTPGIYKVAFRYREEAVGRACFAAAQALLAAAIEDRPYDLAGEVARLKVLADDVRLGPSTATIVEAAEARGIPALRLNEGSLVQLGQGANQHRIWTAETDCTSAIAESIASDKDLTRQLLALSGVPVPEGRLVSSPEDAWEAAESIGLPVVVKPRDGNHGRGVFLELSTREEVEAAYPLAREQGSGVLVERFVPGIEHRLLVIGGRLIAAVRGETAWITGDGVSTVAALVEAQLNSDPRRGTGDEQPLNLVELDPVARMDLKRQGFSPESVPPEGRRVLVQRNGNAACDVTDIVNPDVAGDVILAAQAVGLDIAGVDVVTTDITKPLASQGGAVVEVNASPGLHAHLHPAEGKPRPIGEAIVDSLFPAGANGRVPIACVTGTNGKTTVTRMIGRMLRLAGRRTGMACSDGLFLDGRTVDARDCATPAATRKLLMNPAVDAIACEAGADGILREGLAFDRCDVAVVTAIGRADHLGHAYVDDPDGMFTVKRCAVDVVLPTGTAVLDAEDPLVADMARLSAGAVALFARSPDHPVLAGHAASGGLAAYVREGRITLCENGQEQAVAEVANLPVTRGGRAAFQVRNALAASAAGRALGLSLDVVRAGLESFDADGRELPGRFEWIDGGGRTLVLDACRNVDAVAAVVESLPAGTPADRVAVYEVPTDAREADLEAAGAILATAFSRVFVCDASGPAEPAGGSARTGLCRGLASGGNGVEIVELADPRTAIDAALDRVGPGGTVLARVGDRQIRDAARERVLGRTSKATKATADGDSHRWK